MKPSPATMALPKVPFRGLKPFRYADRFIFFARENETRTLLRLITVYRGVLFYGDSGTGKSSLINAGLVPRAMEYGLTPERIRVQPRLGEEFVVERLLLNDEEPTRFLPSLLTVEEESSRVVVSADEFMSRVRRIPKDQTLLLMMDQFEEWVTLVDQDLQSEAQVQANQAQDRILDVLVGLLRDHSLPVKVLFVFREDYLAKLNRLFRKCPDLAENYLRLTSPATFSLQLIIRGPFEIAQHRHWSTEIPDPVARAIQSEIEGRGHNSINLSEMQVVCLRLWGSGQPEKLYGDRKISGILEDFLEKSLAGLGPLQDPAIALLSRMVTSSGTRNVVSTDDLIERVKKEQGISRAAVENALKALVEETKLVNRELRNDTYFYEIVSEFLVPWIFQKKQKLGAKAARKRFIWRVGWTATVLTILALFAAAWYRQQNTVAALKTEAVQRLEAQQQLAKQTLAAQSRLIEAKSKEAFTQELLRQKYQAEAQVLQTRAELSTVQDNLNSANSKAADLQQTNDQLTAKNDQLQKDLQQEQKQRKDAEDARQKADDAYKQSQDKVTSLHAQLDKMKNQPQEPIDVSKVPKPKLAWLVLSQSDARMFFGDSASRKYKFVQVTVQNPSEFDVKVLDFFLDFDTKNSLLRFQSTFLAFQHSGSGDYYLWHLGSVVSSKSSFTGILAMTPTSQFKEITLMYGLGKVFGTYTINPVSEMTSPQSK